jgi:DNA-binding XRE family transcriptional regulator|nr:MAG TPA: helix-turn-helix domain protein [Caudoviricetes sp.]
MFKLSLRAARVNAGLTVIKAAKELGIGKDTLIKWEKNPGLVNPMWQERIADTYKAPLDILYFLPKN